MALRHPPKALRHPSKVLRLASEPEDGAVARKHLDNGLLQPPSEEKGGSGRKTTRVSTRSSSSSEPVRASREVVLQNSHLLKRTFALLTADGCGVKASSRVSMRMYPPHCPRARPFASRCSV